MTRIYCAQNKGRYSLRAEGHATGSQEACSGVSAITNALMLYAVNEVSHVSTIHTMEEEDGRFCLRFSGDNQAGDGPCLNLQVLPRAGAGDRRLIAQNQPAIL